MSFLSLSEMDDTERKVCEDTIKRKTFERIVTYTFCQNAPNESQASGKHILYLQTDGRPFIS